MAVTVMHSLSTSLSTKVIHQAQLVVNLVGNLVDKLCVTVIDAIVLSVRLVPAGTSFSASAPVRQRLPRHATRGNRQPVDARRWLALLRP